MEIFKIAQITIKFSTYEDYFKIKRTTMIGTIKEIATNSFLYLFIIRFPMILLLLSICK